MLSWTHPSHKVAVHHMDPSCPIISNAAGCGCGSGDTPLHFLAVLVRGLSVFLNKESPVTQIFLFLMVCIFILFLSALPSVCRSFSLLLLSSHTAFCTLASFSLRLLSLSQFFVVFWAWACLWWEIYLFIYLFVSIRVPLFFLSTVIFSLILQQIFLSAVAFSFFPYHNISFLPTKELSLTEKFQLVVILSELWFR